MSSRLSPGRQGQRTGQRDRAARARHRHGGDDPARRTGRIGQLGEQLPQVFAGARATVMLTGHDSLWWLGLYVLATTDMAVMIRRGGLVGLGRCRWRNSVKRSATQVQAKRNSR
jgi:hypothetical protein